MMKKKILILVVLLLIIMQFFRVDKVNPEVLVNDDFIEMTNPSEQVKQLLRSACYDCHSNTTRYPWYTNIAPISWWIKHHVNEGKEHLNFSVWGSYSEKERIHKLEECYEEVEEKEMPLSSYTWLHSGAKLSHEEREKLEHWFKRFGSSESIDGDGD